MKINYQEIYINMDDSGVLHSNERCCIYGGIIFTNKLDQENFGRKYKSILSKIKCKYCRSDISKCKINVQRLKTLILNHNIKGGFGI